MVFMKTNEEKPFFLTLTVLLHQSPNIFPFLATSKICTVKYVQSGTCGQETLNVNQLQNVFLRITEEKGPIPHH